MNEEWKSGLGKTLRNLNGKFQIVAQSRHLGSIGQVTERKIFEDNFIIYKFYQTVGERHSS